MLVGIERTKDGKLLKRGAMQHYAIANVAEYEAIAVSSVGSLMYGVFLVFTAAPRWSVRCFLGLGVEALVPRRGGVVYGVQRRCACRPFLSVWLSCAFSCFRILLKGSTHGATGGGWLVGVLTDGQEQRDRTRRYPFRGPAGLCVRDQR